MHFVKLFNIISNCIFWILEEQEMANEHEWCGSALPVNPAGGSKTKAALLKDTKWLPGQVITISFLGGDPIVKKKVKDVAMQWVAPGLANITFEFPPDLDAAPIPEN